MNQTNEEDKQEKIENEENPSAEEILKRIKNCYGEDVGKAFQGEKFNLSF